MAAGQNTSGFINMALSFFTGDFRCAYMHKPQSGTEVAKRIYCVNMEALFCLLHVVWRVVEVFEPLTLRA